MFTSGVLNCTCIFLYLPTSTFVQYPHLLGYYDTKTKYFFDELWLEGFSKVLAPGVPWLGPSLEVGVDVVLGLGLLVHEPFTISRSVPELRLRRRLPSCQIQEISRCGLVFGLPRSRFSSGLCVFPVSQSQWWSCLFSLERWRRSLSRWVSWPLRHYQLDMWEQMQLRRLRQQLSVQNGAGGVTPTKWIVTFSLEIDYRACSPYQRMTLNWAS